MSAPPTGPGARSLDESFDALVCRPLGRLAAAGFLRTSVTANQVTGLAALAGAGAGAAFAAPWPCPAYGAGLMFLTMVLDCADGEVARRRGGGGWRGRVLDGLADALTAFSAHVGMLIHLIRAGVSVGGIELGPVALFGIAAGAGASMAWRCGVVDDIKQRLKAGSVDRELAAHADEARSLWDRLLYRALTRYVRSIRGYVGRRRPGGYRCFRRAQLVGPTHHHLAMAGAALAVGSSPLAYLAFFLLSLVPANVYLLAVLRVAPGDGEASQPAAGAEGVLGGMSGVDGSLEGGATEPTSQV